MSTYYFRASKLGSIVQLPDGRIGTTVYSGLDGIGIKWGRHDPRPEDFKGTSGNVVDVPDGSPARDPDWPWIPDAMLRDPYPGADTACVGEEYEVLRDEGTSK